jgi:transposase
MGKAVGLRDDFDGDDLRRLARGSRDSDQTRRLLALAVIHDGGSRSDAAKIGGVTLQIIRDWVLRFNASGPEGLKNRWGAGPTPKLTAEHRQALAEMVERGPIPAIHGVVRWRRCDLAQELYETFGVSVEESTIGRALREMGYRKLSARPRHHAQNEYAVEDFKKPSPPSWRKSRRASGAA